MTYYRRAVGFSLRIDPRREDVLVTPLRRATINLPKTRLRQWMQLDHFSETSLALHVLQWLQENDLVYYSDHAASRTTTGAPLRSRTGPVALRGNLKIVPLLRRGDAAVPFDFMPRRQTLGGARLCGAEFRSLEFERVAYTVALAGDETFGQRLRRLVPRLNGQSTWEALSDDADILEWLDACALLTDRAPAPLVADDVCWLGHAGVLLRLGAATIAVDPMFFPTPEPKRAWQWAPPDWRRLPPLDAIAITHGDNDHLHARSLFLVDEATPVIVAKPPAIHDYQVDIEGVLSVLGFTRVTALADWERSSVGDVQVQAAPFLGEDWGLTLQKCTFVITGPRGAVYLAADSRPDESALRRIGAEQSIALAFLGVSGCAEPLGAHPDFGYGDFYRAVLDPKQRNQWWEHCADPTDAARSALWLGAKAGFGYAAGGGPFIQLAHSDSGDHAALAQALAESSTRAVALPLGQPLALAQLGRLAPL